MEIRGEGSFKEVREEPCGRRHTDTGSEALLVSCLTGGLTSVSRAWWRPLHDGDESW